MPFMVSTHLACLYNSELLKSYALLVSDVSDVGCYFELGIIGDSFTIILRWVEYFVVTDDWARDLERSLP